MDYKNIMIIGSGNRATKLVKLLENHKEYGMKVSCIVDSDFKNKKNIKYKIGNYSKSIILSSLSIDDVFVCTNINEIPFQMIFLNHFIHLELMYTLCRARNK